MNELNVYGAAPQERGLDSVTAAMATTRQAQEVQAAMVVAKRFPRDERQSMERILTACQRRSLAESAMYEYSRGGTTVTGPSIRLAECMAQNWGNIDCGYIELEQRNGESQVMAYAWDLETNTRQSKIFSVPHIRQTKKGSYPLTDPRDIYEQVANQAARRVRACILAVIPGDVIENAVKQCENTLRGGSTQPLEERIQIMVERFGEDFGVTPEQLRAYIGKNVEAFSENDVVRLGKVYRSLKDGVIGSDYFMDRLTETPPESAPELPEAAEEPEPAHEEQVNLDEL